MRWRVCTVCPAGSKRNDLICCPAVDTVWFAARDAVGGPMAIIGRRLHLVGVRKEPRAVERAATEPASEGQQCNSLTLGPPHTTVWVWAKDNTPYLDADGAVC